MISTSKGLALEDWIEAHNEITLKISSSFLSLKSPHLLPLRLRRPTTRRSGQRETTTPIFFSLVPLNAFVAFSPSSSNLRIVVLVPSVEVCEKDLPP